MEKVTCIIIGASAAGLACAAQLQKRGISYQLLEQHDHVGQAWRNHYDRLHLHTPKSESSLPFVKFNSSVGKYPSKQQVVDYLNNYIVELGIEPIFNTAVTHVERENNNWIVQTNKEKFESEYVIFCTGNTNKPKAYNRPGLSKFQGDLLHSSEYKNGRAWKGKNVLVVGFGNSACEIAIDLHEHGAQPTQSVRSAVNVVPRDILGIPVLQIGIWQSAISPEISDRLNKPLLKLLVGDITKYGLKKLPYGPQVQMARDNRIPLLDIGTMHLIRKGHISIRGDVTKVDGKTVTFENGESEDFDCIVSAVGYETGLSNMINLPDERLDDIKLNYKDQKFFGEDNLFFCGFHVSPAGMLREFRIESEAIVNSITHL